MDGLRKASSRRYSWVLWRNGSDTTPNMDGKISLTLYLSYALREKSVLWKLSKVSTKTTQQEQGKT